jgi:adenosylhomocysteine nucleosidase
MDPPRSVLVCFAVKEEAKFFRPELVAPRCGVVVTGMGPRNAAAAARKALAGSRPDLVITAGFAGGLNPELKAGTVVFDADAGISLAAELGKLGAIAARFYTADRVAVTAADKAALRQATGADAVEMESGVIRGLCREQQLASATVRVVSDAAGEDLPLDFNCLMTADDRIDYLRLAWAVGTRPGRISALLSFQRQTLAAARILADALTRSLRGGG